MLLLHAGADARTFTIPKPMRGIAWRQFIDYNAPSLQGPLPKRPEDLPHGLVAPPERGPGVHQPGPHPTGPAEEKRASKALL